MMRALEGAGARGRGSVLGIVVSCIALASVPALAEPNPARTGTSPYPLPATAAWML